MRKQKQGVARKELSKSEPPLAASRKRMKTTAKGKGKAVEKQENQSKAKVRYCDRINVVASVRPYDLLSFVFRLLQENEGKGLNEPLFNWLNRPQGSSSEAHDSP